MGIANLRFAYLIFIRHRITALCVGSIIL
ncbi:hypothetical protein MY874_07705 [Haemophilus influenzae]|nr:hypothetical protein [Haemophilus influenzae]